MSSPEDSRSNLSRPDSWSDAWPDENGGDVKSLNETTGSLLAKILEGELDVDAVVDRLREAVDDEGPRVYEDAVAVVTEAELADPRSLAHALAPLQSKAARFEHLCEKARQALDRLSAYQLSRKSTDALVETIREQESYDSTQFLVDFLNALERAASAFEALELPGPHVRDYLRHLYLMKDWMEMRRLVAALEEAVETTLAHQQGWKTPKAG